MSPFLAQLSMMPSRGSFAFAHPFGRYTTVQLLLSSRRVLMPERCQHALVECWPRRPIGRLLASMRRHCLSRSTWRPRRGRAQQLGPFALCFYSHSL